MFRLKRKKTIWEKEREFRIGFYGMTFLFFFLALCTSYIIMSSPLQPRNSNQQINYQSVVYSDVDINYMDNFTDEEKSIINEVLFDLNPDYTVFVKQINFTKSRQNVADFCLSESPDVVGCNGNDKIMIYYQKGFFSQDLLRMAVCHEILHSLIFSSEKSHKVVYDLGYKEVCFLNKNSKHLSSLLPLKKND